MKDLNQILFQLVGQTQTYRNISIDYEQKPLSLNLFSGVLKLLCSDDE